MIKSISFNPLTLLSTFVLLSGLMLAGQSRAELRCDCSQLVETCSAEISFNDNEIEIESDNDACSRVDYLIDGQPYTALVVDGETEFNWSGQPQSSPQIVVENCRVCADAVEENAPIADTPAAAAPATEPAEQAAPATEPAEEAASAEGEFKALVKVMPAYPRSAWGQGIEGSVIVEFDVSADGVVQNIKLVNSSAPVFDNASIDAVSRFRFTSGTPVESVQEEFTFRLLNGSEPTVSSATL